MGRNNHIDSKGIFVFACLLIIILMSTSTMAQYTWSRRSGSFEIPYLPVTFAIQSISDGGFIVATNAEKECSTGYNNILITRYNSSGGIVWQEALDLDSYNAVRSIAIASDGGFVIAGNASNDIRIVKLNSSGSILWQKRYGLAQDDYAYSIKPTADNGFIIAGYTNLLHSDNTYDGLIMKIDASGGILWQKTYGGASDDYLYSIELTGDGGYIAVGWTSSFGTGGEAWIIKVDSTGQLIWQKIIGGTGYDAANSIARLSNGNYVLAGTTNSFGAGNGDCWIIIIDSSGNIISQKTYGGSNDDYGYSVKATSDSGFIVSGAMYFPGRAHDVWVIKCAQDGTEMWQKSYGTASIEEYGYDIAQSPDNFYAIVSPGQWYRNLIWVFKVNAAGEMNTNCTFVNTTFIAGSGSIALAQNSGASFADSSLTMADTTIQPQAFLGENVMECQGFVHAPHIAVDPDGIIFDRIMSGCSNQKNLTVRNDGDMDLAINSMTLPSAPFSVTGNTCNGATLPPSGTCSMTLHFEPTASGTYSDDVTINTNDPDNPSLIVKIAGTTMGLSGGTWIHSYYYNPSCCPESITSLHQTPDKGYIAAGFGDKGNSSGSSGMRISKLSAEGNIAWQQIYSGAWSDSHCNYSIIPTQDGGYAVTTANNNGKTWILKLASIGSIVWQNTYDSGYSEIPHSIVQTSDGNYIIAGRAQNNSFVLKVNSNGDAIWKKTFDSTNFNELYSIQQTTNGGFIAAGSTYDDCFMDTFLWVLRLDSNGNIVWQKAFPGYRSPMLSGLNPAGVHQLDDNGFIIVYNSDEPMQTGTILIKLDESGDLIWEKLYGDSTAYAWTIEKTSDGNIVVGGTGTVSSTYDSLWLFKVNRDGSMIWQKMYNVLGGIAHVMGLEETQDLKLIVAGDIPYRNWIFKINEDGIMHSSCASSTTNVAVTSGLNEIIVPNISQSSASVTKGATTAIPEYIPDNETIVCGIGSYSPNIEVIPDPVDFGNVLVNTTEQKTAIISNTGSDPLHIGLLSGLLSPFSLIGTTCSCITLTTSASCQADIQFHPGSAQSYSDYFMIASDDPINPVLQVTVQGKGVSSTEPNITVTPAPVYLYVLAGGTKNATITITNAGIDNLNIGTITPPASPFSITSDSCSGHVLAKQEQCQIIVQFASITKGTYTDSISIPSNDPDTPNLSVALYGLASGLWAQAYGGTGNEILNSIELTLDGGFIAAGTTTSFGSVLTDAWIIKLNNDGAMEWQKKYGTSNDDSVVALKPLKSGGYIGLGRSGSSWDLWVFKLNNSGNIEWQQFYMQNGVTPHDIIATKDGGYMAAAASGSPSSIWIVKLDATGNIIWQKSYQFHYDYPYHIVEDADGNYIISGEDALPFGILTAGSSYLLFKIDSSGTMLWSKMMDINYRNYAPAFLLTADGGYLVAGGETFYHENVIMKLDSNRNVVWQKSFNYPVFKSAAELNDGNYLVAGNASGVILCIKLSPGGTILFSKQYTALTGNYQANSVQATYDGGFIIGGTVDGVGAGGSDFWILKLDSNGEIDTSCLSNIPYQLFELSRTVTTKVFEYVASTPYYYTDYPAQTSLSTNAATLRTCEWPAAAPGAVPDNNHYPGIPLTVSKTGNNIRLDWGAPGGSCVAIDYGVYIRELPFDGYYYGAYTCTTQGNTNIILTGQNNSYYYLVVPQSASREGSYGVDSSGVQRPPSSYNPCHPQNLDPC